MKPEDDGDYAYDNWKDRQLEEKDSEMKLNDDREKRSPIPMARKKPKEVPVIFRILYVTAIIISVMAVISYLKD